MSKSSDKEAYAKIGELVEKAHELIKEAEEIAKKNKLEFNFDVSYGMGGTFYGYPFETNYGDKMQFGWEASSQTC